MDESTPFSDSKPRIVHGFFWLRQVLLARVVCQALGALDQTALVSDTTKDRSCIPPRSGPSGRGLALLIPLPLVEPTQAAR